MNKKLRNVDIIFKLGFIGLIGGLITIISDFILLGRPYSAYEFFRLGTQSMADIADWRITIGTMVGVIALPFQTLGIIPAYYGLKSSGKVLPLIFAIVSAHALLMGVAFHMSYAYIGSGWRLYYENKINSDILERFDYFWNLLIVIMLVEIIFYSIIYVIIIRKGKSIFPKWMVFFNPFIITLIVLSLIYMIPSPIGGFIAPACLNLSTMIFVGIIMMVLSRRIKKHNAIG